MRRLHLLLAIRQLRTNRSFTLLNILGLTLGMATFFFIVLYVVDELNYDRYNTNANRIYRVNTDLKVGDRISSMADAAPPVAGLLRDNYPEVQSVTRVFPQYASRFKKGTDLIEEHHIAIADSDFFKVFTLPMIAGDPATALQRPNSLVISESTAQKYFSSTQVIGRTLMDVDEDSVVLTVTGVIRDMPKQSSFHYDFIRAARGSWLDTTKFILYALYPMSTFIELKPGADVAAFQHKLAGFMPRWEPNYDKKESSFFLHLGLTPLTDIHLRSNRTDELEPNGSILNIYIFSAIAVFVLLLSAINFINLATARSTGRAREVGVRKVLGSARASLIGQFLTESFLTTLLATVLALGLTILLLPFFNTLAGKSLAFDGRTLAWFLPSSLLIVVGVGFLAGAWPAFFLSAFRPVDVLKGQPVKGARASFFRNCLVVFQFSVSLFLIVGTLVVYRQLHYIQNKDLGFDRSHILVIDQVNYLSNPESYKKASLENADVRSATLSRFLPTGDHRWHNWGLLKGGDDNSIETQLWLVDPDYIPTLQMKIVKGRSLSHDFGTDSTGIVLNESAAKAYGITGDPLNKVISFPFFGGRVQFRVVGIIKDFNFASLRDNVTPLALVVNKGYEMPDKLILRIQSDHLASTLNRLKTQWTAIAPHTPFSYSFMDADFDALYQTEQRMGRISILFSALAIIIACLGLFGLAAYAAERRTKEISIRKVLGATAPNIITLLSVDFFRLIAMAIFIAIPLAWLALSSWLNNFAYRTTIDAWVFIAGGLTVCIIAFATTLFQTLRAAFTNPADTLRTE
jgi:putative ABC transport system permease protein